MPIFIDTPVVAPKRTNVLFMLGEYSDGAVLTTLGDSEPGTAVTDLQRPQPQDFWGQASPATILVNRPTRAAFGAIAMPYASVPRETTWRRRFGDSDAERDGTHLRDATDSGHRATLRNGAKCGPGLLGGALELGESGTQYADTTVALVGQAQGTMEVAAKGERRAQWLAYHAAGDGVARGLYQDASGIVHVHRGNPTPILSSASPLPDDGAWHHVAYPFDDLATGDLSLVFDGGVVGTANNFADPATGLFTIGNGDPAIAPCAAGLTLDEIRYWSVTRTLGQIQATMARELTDVEVAQCLAYYRCNAFDSGEQLFPAPAAYDLWSMPDPRCHGWDFLERPWLARSARIDITGPTFGQILRFGRLLMGVPYQPTRQSADKGRTYGHVDETDFERGPGALLTADPASPYKVTEFLVDAIPQDELYGDWERLQLLLAGGKPGLVVLNPVDPDFLHHKFYYGTVKFQLFGERNWDHHFASVRVEGMP